ncbi:MAG: flippase-like domain-containing protein [Candidatus Sumerlaeaceae bacterium]|nr:flippase-like domain-containing protein [Candidatus Sumerlaeaceae bacterium]
MPNRHNARTRRRNILIRVFIAGTLLAGIFSLHAKLGDTLHAIVHANLGFVVAGLAVRVGSDIITTFKWKRLLKVAGISAPFPVVYRANLIGAFYGLFLPGAVAGDIARTVVIAPRAGGKAPALASMFMQRNTGMAACLVIANIGSWINPVTVSLFSGSFSFMNHLAFWFALITAAYLVTNFLLLNNAVFHLLWSRSAAAHHAAPQLHHANDFRSRVRRFWESAVRKFARLHDSVLRYRSGILPAVMLSFVTQLGDCLVVWCVSRAIDSPLPFLVCCVFVPAVMLMELLPISIAGVGLRDACYVALFASIGRKPESAVAISFVLLGYYVTIALVGGLIQWLSPVNVEAAEAD